MIPGITLGSLVELPRLTASDTATLVAQFETQAKALPGGRGTRPKLPAAIRAALSDAVGKGTALAKANQRRTAGKVPKRTPEQRAADLRIDAGWSGLRDWLRGWRKLGDDATTPSSADAGVVLDDVFGGTEGLKFITLEYEDEWHECDKRLRRVDDVHAATIRALGGVRFITRLHVLQREYGDALGITAVQTPSPTPVRVQKLMLEAQDAARVFIGQVLAYKTAGGASAVKLADHLLAPLGEWQRRAKLSRKPRTPASKKGAAPSRSAPDGKSTSPAS
jgi:hypothetical protein